MTVRNLPSNLPLVGFLGLEANRGPFRYKDCTKEDLTDDYVLTMRENVWESLKPDFELKLREQLPASAQELTQSFLENVLTRLDLPEKDKQFCINYLIGDPSFVKDLQCETQNKTYKKARSLFDSDTVIQSLFPIANLISGIAKIIIGIGDDGRSYGVIEEDRGWKFRATVIAVGIAEICFLGLIVHGIATLYFAMTSLEAQAAQA